MTTPEDQAKTDAIIERVKKLLAMAAGNANENEAATASRMAQALMEQHNIDMAVLGKSGKGKQGAARKDTKEKGGLYGWQRALWKATAELNMCVYWSIKGLARGSVYEHRILGSEVNVLATNLMAEYLQKTIDRLAQEKARTDGYKSPFVRELIAYREGMASRLVERLREARAERIREDERKAREAKAAASHPSAAPGTAIVLADVIANEADLNEDYLRGVEPGTTSRERREREARAAMLKHRRDLWLAGDAAVFLQAYGEDDVTAMVAQDTREAKAKADWDLYMAGKPSDTYGAGYKKPRASRATGGGYRYRADTPQEARARLSTFQEGRAKGDTVSLNKQVDKTSRKGIG